MTRREWLALAPGAALTALKAADAPFERIDGHFHLHRSSPVIVAGMEKTAWRALSICVCGGVADEPYDLDAQLRGTAKLRLENRARIAWAAAFDARNFEKSDFAADVITSLRRCFAQGAVGVKIWKNIGMAIRSKSGAYLKPDNVALFPIYEAIQNADRTLLVHVADPIRTWTADANAAGSLGAPSWWRLYRAPGAPDNWWMLDKRPDAPRKAELLLARDRILARFPKLRVVGVHLGSDEEDLHALARRLDQYPNFAVDAAARVSFLARQDRETARQFLVKYQDRILYGSDSIVLPDPAEDDETWRSVNAAHEREWRFFATADVIRFGGGTSTSPAREAQGLELPESALRKIFRENSERWYPGILGA
jgi:predicted TIM-barrel fold metal-dependent hydrolase